MFIYNGNEKTYIKQTEQNGKALNVQLQWPLEVGYK